MLFLGIDTSNYTTSAALYFSESNEIRQFKKLLPVKRGEKGLRQSDAVFHHTQQLPSILRELSGFMKDKKLTAIGVSSRPRNQSGSYMPCFTVGLCAAESISSFTGAERFEFSHQQGHIAAALFSAGRLDLISEPFIAFHVSGGTTEALLVTPDKDDIIKCEIIACSLDLKAGQAVDRTGVMLGLDFPCGAEIDALARKSEREFKIKPVLKDGNCSLSGVENKCRDMISRDEKSEDVARFCIEYISASLEKMTESIIEKHPGLPIIYAGGVMSNSIIRERFTEKFGAYFAEKEFSADNAAGAAILAYFRERKNEHCFNC